MREEKEKGAVDDHDETGDEKKPAAHLLPEEEAKKGTRCIVVLNNEGFSCC